MQDKFSVGDLVEYADDLPFAKNLNSVGVIIEIVDFRDEWQKIEADSSPEYAKGIMEELRMFHALRSVEREPDLYPADRQRMLEKMLACSDEEVLESTRLLRVVWNTGESYVEHPSDLKIVLKITEKNN